MNKENILETEVFSDVPPVKQIPEEAVDYAIHYLFPDLEKDSVAYKAIENYIHAEFKRLHCVVLYRRSASFSKFLKTLHLDCGDKEVQINRNRSVSVSENFRINPKMAFEV